MTPRHARNFSVTYTETGKSVLVRYPSARTGGADLGPDDLELRYHLIPCGGQRGPGDLGYPPETVATASTTVLAHLEALDELDRLVGHQGLGNVTSPAVLARAERGLVREIGDGARTDPEKLLALAPDLYLSYLSGTERAGSAGGMPVIYLADHLEVSPLARAEWILFTSLFFDRERQALDLFNEVEKRYAELAQLALSAGSRPKVLFSAPFGGVWHVPGGRSFPAQLIEDAGGDYLWRDLEAVGSLPMDIEAVWERAHEADLWLQPFGWRSLEEGIEADPRFAQLPALVRADVFNNDLRLGPDGGNDYWETGALRPDLVLADLVHIFHPDLLPDHELVFHRRLPRRATPDGRGGGPTRGVSGRRPDAAPTTALPPRSRPRETPGAAGAAR